jgi:hypothetical protein
LQARGAEPLSNAYKDSWQHWWFYETIFAAMKLISYPDVSDILTRKVAGRNELSKLTFGEKIARMEALRDRLQPFRQARLERKAKGAPGFTDSRDPCSNADDVIRYGARAKPSVRR